MDEREIDWERLDRYVRGDGTPKERAALEAWVDANVELGALAESMRRVGELPGEPAREWNVRAAWLSVEREMRRVGRPSLRIFRATPRTLVPGFRGIGLRREPQSVWRRLPAVAALCVAAALIFVPSAVRRGSDAPGSGTRSTQPMREIATRRGQMATLDLVDGTRVVLSAESRLRIPADFGTANRLAAREVYLEGEGFFEVVHDGARPFRVHTRLGIAEELGTKFAVTTYPELGELRVAVESGEVAILRPAPLPAADGTPAKRRAARTPALVTLRRGDVAGLDSAGVVTLTRDVDVAPFFAAADGELLLDKALVRDAVRRLERWYDITIQLRDTSLLDRTLSGRFRAESAEQAIAVVALSLEARARWDGRTVVLSRAVRRTRVP